MIRTAAVTCAAFAASLCLGFTGQGGAVAAAHLAFAAGVLPLILAAIIHFVPVLTRSGDPRAAVTALPSLAQLTGGFVAAAFAGLVPRWTLQGAALVDVVLVSCLLAWVVARARRCLGAPHPGWRWYGAALACAVLALAPLPLLLAGVAAAELRLWHLHLNVLGLVGLAALGTLPVLLPTVLGLPDSGAATWLRRQWLPMLAGVGAVAAGAALAWPLALVGAGILLVLVLGLLGHWLRRFEISALLAGGAAASLASAVLGLLLSLVAGAAHGMGILPARPAIALWVFAFLLPLVSGALSGLLPVWRYPGAGSSQRARWREALARWGRLRASAFLLAGLAMAAGWESAAALLAAGGFAGFLLAATLPLGGGSR